MFDFSSVIEIYCDGGIINSNPSPIGGTWAFCGVNALNDRVVECGGVIQSSLAEPITNNTTEQIAIVTALEMLPDGWSGLICSDSQIALGRVFKGWQTNGLPDEIIRRTTHALARMGRIEHKLLQGHPTKADLACGIGKKRQLPVSIHNVWCDKRCQQEAYNYLTILGPKVDGVEWE